MAEKTVPSTVDTKAPARRDEGTRGEERFLAPPVDIYETKDGLTVVADLPGVEKDGVDVRVDDGVLTIEGRTARQADGNLIHSEFTLSDFYRQFELGEEVDQERIAAQMKHGVLTIHLPKSEKAKPRQIAVRVE
ncbi:MAG: Hsp20/alpha crystallin family protein [Candidatus Sumerlaeota bacterium]|nr:Hsp20/alpha crystallin family protein [Candidatus Sumerlaeota bacterium]